MLLEETAQVILNLPLEEGETVRTLSFVIRLQNVGEDDVERVKVDISTGSGVW